MIILPIYWEIQSDTWNFPIYFTTRIVHVQSGTPCFPVFLCVNITEKQEIKWYPDLYILYDLQARRNKLQLYTRDVYQRDVVRDAFDSTKTTHVSTQQAKSKVVINSSYKTRIVIYTRKSNGYEYDGYNNNNTAVTSREERNITYTICSCIRAMRLKLKVIYTDTVNVLRVYLYYSYTAHPATETGI